MLAMEKTIVLRRAFAFFLFLALAPLSAVAVVSSDPFTRDASTPFEEGMNAELVGALFRAIETQNARTDSEDRVDSIIVIRHGKVVVEEYPDFVKPASLVRPLGAATRSITSLLVGIAIDRGLIAGINDPILSYFPNAVPASQADLKGAVTIEHLLAMTVGLEWNEVATFAHDSDVPAMAASADPVSYVLGKPLVDAPGERFLENSGLPHVLSALLTEVTGAPALLLAREFLFDPLGIGATPWIEDKARSTRGWNGLSMTPRDLARIGVLCLGNGTWSGHEIVSSEWIAVSTQAHAAAPTDEQPTRGHGCGWWTDAEAGIYYAEAPEGAGLYVCPALDLVIVLTGAVTEGDVCLSDLVRDYILPAAASQTLALGSARW
jgi:CubicO group peptidase (beta-lactamase class C family)